MYTVRVDTYSTQHTHQTTCFDSRVLLQKKTKRGVEKNARSRVQFDSNASPYRTLSNCHYFSPAKEVSPDSPAGQPDEANHERARERSLANLEKEVRSGYAETSYIVVVMSTVLLTSTLHIDIEMARYVELPQDPPVSTGITTVRKQTAKPSNS